MIESNSIDWSVYLVTSRDRAREASPRTLPYIVEHALVGGVGVVQLRDKNVPRENSVQLGLNLNALCQSAGVPLIVNDDPTLAYEIGAAGVHLGQSDPSVAEARNILGPTSIVGVSVESPEEALRAQADGANYLGAGVVFPTRTKTDAGELIGLDGLRAITEVATIPVVAIGGITRHNAAEIIRAGAAGIAVISAIFASPFPHDAAQELSQMVEAARRKRL